MRTLLAAFDTWTWRKFSHSIWFSLPDPEVAASVLSRRTYLIFLRYAELYVALNRWGGLPVDATRRDFGITSRVCLHGNHLIIIGWSAAMRARLAPPYVGTPVISIDLATPLAALQPRLERS